MHEALFFLTSSGKLVGVSPTIFLKIGIFSDIRGDLSVNRNILTCSAHQRTCKRLVLSIIETNNWILFKKWKWIMRRLVHSCHNLRHQITELFCDLFFKRQKGFHIWYLQIAATVIFGYHFKHLCILSGPCVYFLNLFWYFYQNVRTLLSVIVSTIISTVFWALHIFLCYNCLTFEYFFNRCKNWTFQSSDIC